MKSLLVSLSLLFCAEVFSATSTTWTNLSGGFWKDATNWSGGAPTNNQVSIVNTNSKEVIIDAATPGVNLTISRLQLVGPPNVTNTLSVIDLGPGNPLSIVNNTTALTVGRGGAMVVSNSAIIDAGTLTISNGGSMRLSSSAVTLNGQDQPLSIYGGSLTLESGSIVVNDSPARVGRGTNGALIVNGGTVYLVGDMTLGESTARSAGLLQMSGGSVTLQSMLTMGENVGCIGTLLMTGGTLVATNGTNGLLRVGNIGIGQMLLSNATVRASSLTLGEGPPPGSLLPTGIVSVASGHLIIDPDKIMDPNFTNIVRIGDYGMGQMTVSNGGVVLLPNTSIARHSNSVGRLTVLTNGFVGFSDDVSIGRFSGATGTVVIAGGEIINTNSPIWVGRDGVGQLNMTNGLLKTPSLFVAMVPTNTARGSFNFSGGTVLLSSNLVLGDASLSTGQIAMVRGSLIITNETSSGLLAVSSGKFTFSGGEIAADSVVMTNSGATFSFGGGTLHTRSTIVSNGLPFVVGDGTNAATLNLQGGTHDFANGLIISSNATLTGCGTIIGTVQINGTDARNCAVVKPSITQHPQSQTVTNGGTAQFSVTATGTQPLSYQWRRNETNAVGANSSTLSFSPVQAANAGSYDVVVSNSGGSVTSLVAVLRVLLPPTMTNPNYSGQNFGISFQSENGLDYTLVYKNVLTDPSWEPLRSITGDGNLLQLVDTNALAPTRFYRILVQ